MKRLELLDCQANPKIMQCLGDKWQGIMKLILGDLFQDSCQDSLKKLSLVVQFLILTTLNVCLNLKIDVI